MKYHSVYMIFNLLYLKNQVEQDSSIKIDDLRGAFYEYQDNINRINNVQQELDFDSEIETIIEDFSSIFIEYNDEISFVDEDPDNLYELIPELLDDEPTPIDIYMEDCLSNESIFFALKLNPPFEQMQNIFETNKAILTLYKLIAKLESEHKDPSTAIKLIRFHKNNLKEFFTQIDKETRIKIKLCLAHYNEKYLSDEASPNINANWHIALLSNDQRLRYSLTYDKIYSYIDEEYEESEELESQDLVSSFGLDDTSEEEQADSLPTDFLADTCYVADEVEYFLANYILYLNSYINKEQNSEIKKLLLERKYLLLSTNVLDDVEDYYLENGSLDTMPLPSYIKDWFTPKSFDFLVGNFEEILANIRISNDQITSAETSNIAINLLLLKCFLDLSIDTQTKAELLSELTSSDYYKNPNYLVTTELIDKIIFPHKGIDRTRKNKRKDL